MTVWQLDRRAFLRRLGVATAGLWLAPRSVGAAGPVSGPHTKPIPSSGEALPVVGMGTWQTFDVHPEGAALERRLEILRRFFAAGGGMIDSSPMYGRSEAVVGHCLARLGDTEDLFSATKVWSPFQWLGRKQIADSKELWGLERLDLEQVHNLVSWQDHLETLRAEREAGGVRYLGVTTSHGRRHAEMERVLRAHDWDFVQLTYNLLDREAEERLLPLAAERGIAVIANRPFGGGGLIRRLERHPLPAWAGDVGCTSWPPLLLKWIVSHPALTCAIPATTDPAHMSENMTAAHGRLPDADLRRALVRYVEGL